MSSGVLEDDREILGEEEALADQLLRRLRDESQVLVLVVIALFDRPARIAAALPIGGCAREGNI